MRPPSFSIRYRRKRITVRQPRSKLNRMSVVTASGRAKERVTDTIERARKLEEDPDKKLRLERQMCKACYYFTHLGGAAMTNRECAGCGKDELYASTATEALCLDCAGKFELCKRCGGDIDMGVNRRKWPEFPIDRSENEQ